MFDIGGFELLLIAVVALIFIKPEDLPKFMEKLGQGIKYIKDVFLTAQEHKAKTISHIKKDLKIPVNKYEGLSFNEMMKYSSKVSKKPKNKPNAKKAKH